MHFPVLSEGILPSVSPANFGIYITVSKWLINILSVNYALLNIGMYASEYLLMCQAIKFTSVESKIDQLFDQYQYYVLENTYLLVLSLI